MTIYNHHDSIFDSVHELVPPPSVPGFRCDLELAIASDAGLRFLFKFPNQ